MKTVYVAAGSTSVEAMIKLIERYKTQDLYATTNDYFIGLDSAQEVVDRLARLDANNAHILGIQLEHDPEGSPQRNLIRSFRPEWVNLDVPRAGVGGDRRISRATLKWKQNVNFLSRIQTLAVGDQLILLGTAFGGTATGVYWNLAYWLRSMLPKDGGGHTADFYTLVLFPAACAMGGKYSSAHNFCSFMKTMQSRQFAMRIDHQFVDVPFRVPEISLYDGGETLPLWDRTVHGYSQHSFLPFDRFFVVPSYENGIAGTGVMPEVIAEQAFVLGALDGSHAIDICRWAIDQFGGNSGPLNNPVPENCFGGFNMVVGLSPKNNALRARFWGEFSERVAMFRLAGGARAASDELRGKLADRFRAYCSDSRPADASLAGYRERLRTIMEAPVETISGALNALVDEAERTMRVLPFNWMGFPDYLQHCEAWVKEAFQGAEVSADSFLTLTDLAEVYLGVVSEILLSASQLQGVKGRVMSLVNDARQNMKKRTKTFTPGRFPVKVLGCESKIKEEVRQRLWAAEVELIVWLCGCARSRGTVLQLPGQDLEKAEAMIRAEATRIDNQILQAKLEAAIGERRNLEVGQQHASCIYEAPPPANATSLLRGLSIPDSKYLEILLNFIGQPHDAGRVAVLDDAERESVQILNVKARQLGAANPLTQLNVDLTTATHLEAHSRVFNVPDAREWHHHFFLQGGIVQPITWQQLEGYSTAFRSFEGLTNMPVGPQQHVVPATLAGLHYCNTTPAMASVQGVWIGTLSLDEYIRSIINSTYQHNPIGVYDAVSFAEYNDGASPRTLLRIDETLALGSLLGAIEARVLEFGEGFNRRAHVVNVTVGGQTVSFSLSVQDMGLVFHQINGENRMRAMLVSWVKPLMKLIGFRTTAFWADGGALEEFRALLVDMDRRVLQTIDLGVSKEFTSGVRKTAEKAMACVSVE